jgi:DNA-binding response OmpR family regulator
MANERILVVDDEAKIVRIVRAYLERDGYRVAEANDGQTALDLVQRDPPDLIVLDLMLPAVAGWDVCRAIRRHPSSTISAIPIVMLTARDDVSDRIVGLELGADDYLVKPFDPNELIARVHAVLRRLRPPEQPGFLRRGDLTIDPERHEAWRGDTRLTLTPTEFDLLATMARHPGRVYSRLQLLEASQGDAFEGYERAIDSHIKNLRRKLEPDPRRPRYVLTVFGVGYKFGGSDDLASA